MMQSKAPRGVRATLRVAVHCSAGAIALALLPALTGCALKPLPEAAEVTAQALPATTRIPPVWQAYASAGPDTAASPDDWLKSFNDPALQAIVAEALAHNPDLQAAAAQVAIA